MVELFYNFHLNNISVDIKLLAIQFSKVNQFQEIILPFRVLYSIGFRIVSLLYREGDGIPSYCLLFG